MALHSAGQPHLLEAGKPSFLELGHTLPAGRPLCDQQPGEQACMEERSWEEDNFKLPGSFKVLAPFALCRSGLNFVHFVLMRASQIPQT